MKQNGNALFLILIAVALFAALFYAVTQNNRGGENVGEDKAKLKATQIAQYAAQLAATVHKLQVVNGCAPDEIDFGINFTNPSFYCWGNPPDNPARRTDGTCDVYGAEGGGMTPRYFDTSYCKDEWGTCAFLPMTAAIENVGTTVGEDLVWWSHGIHVDICRAINNELGINSTLASTGYNVGSDYLSTGGESTIAGEFSGKKSGCYCRSGPTGECNFFFTLIER